MSTFSDGYLLIEYRADAAFQSQGPESELNKPPATCMLTKLDSDKSRLDLDSERKVAANLAVWYQIDGPEEGFGTKWLPDLRQWWRRSGRNLEFPVDGLTSATRPASRPVTSRTTRTIIRRP